MDEYKPSRERLPIGSNRLDRLIEVRTAVIVVYFLRPS